MCISACFLMLSLTALAASCKGAIWANKPNFLGGGYYCTAARNDSDPITDLNYAKAISYNSAGGQIAAASTPRNVTAIANSGSVKPNKGYGEYGITGYACKSSSNFNSSAYD